jgi:hypothetical protein
MPGMVHDNIRNHPVIGMVISLLPLGLAIYGTVTGTAIVKSSKVERAKNPAQYWLALALEYGLFVEIVILTFAN